MHWKNIIWKYTTAFIVLLIILNPEMLQLAFFIDAIGLAMFLTLIEIQLFALLSNFYNTNIKRLFIPIIKLCARYSPIASWKEIKQKPEYLILAIPTPASLMSMLVLVAAIDIIFILN